MMGSIMRTVNITATGTKRLTVVSPPSGAGAMLQCIPSSDWSGSIVLSRDTAGYPETGVSAPVLSNTAYTTASTGAVVAAGTAITGSAAVIVHDIGLSIWATSTVTTGSCLVQVMQAGGVTEGIGAVQPGDIAAGTFGAYSAETGAYNFPGAVAMSGALSGVAQIAFAAGSTSHFIDFEGMTLSASKNAIRGVSVNPTRGSGWISFSGTVGATPAQVYSDYRELHTTGVAEVLGFGSFPYMDSGSSCASMFAHQAIAYVSTGATVATAAGAAGVGIFAFTGKTVIDGATFHSSGVAAVAHLSFQVNVTNVQALDTSILNMEVASGGIQQIFKFRCTAAKGATYFVNLADNGEPATKTTAKTTQTNNVVGSIKVLIGDQVAYINAHSAAAA